MSIFSIISRALKRPETHPGRAQSAAVATRPTAERAEPTSLVPLRSNRASVVHIPTPAGIVVPTARRRDPKNSEKDPNLAAVIRAIRDRAPVTLIHGRAGTGKTTLIRRVVAESELNCAILAPTGVAALNAGGQTIHSFFGLPWGIVNLDEIAPKDRRRSILRRLDFLVIDEVSMVRADLLDAVDRSMQVNLGRSEPFGGLPVVLVGDFLQLPPVVESADEEILKKLGYESPFAFAAHCLRNLSPRLIELATVYRQSEAEFIALLGKLRVGDDVYGTVAALNRLCHRPHRSSAVPVILTARTASAESHNLRGLNALPGALTTYTGRITGEFSLEKKRLPAPEFLDLKVGSRVMLVKNDPKKRWVNGTLATVTKLAPASVWVRLDETQTEHEITAESWENVKYEWNHSENRVAATAVGAYSQIPLIPAWATTIHKAQGLTLADVRVDLGGGAFSEGQTYVALSRAKSINGLSFVKPISAGDVRVSQHLVNGVERLVGRASQQ